MKKTNIKFIKRISQIILIGAIFFFFIKQLIANWDKILDYDWRLNYTLLFLAILLYVFSMIFHSFNWTIIFKNLGEKLRLRKAMRIWLSSLAAKYLPGTVWQYLGQMYLCKKEGIAKTKTITVQVIEFSMNTISALFVFLISILFLDKAIVGYKEILISIIIIIGTILFLRSSLLKRIINFGLKLIKRDPIDFNLPFFSLFFIFVLFSMVRIIQGIAFYLFVLSMTYVSLKMLPVLVGVFSISWVVGYLFVIAPGGLGVRESAFVFFLYFFFPLPVAIMISLVSRIWIMVSEFISILIGFIVESR